MMDDCPYCGQPLDEDADDVIDSPRGYAHEDCVQEYERDAEGRACVDLKKFGARLFVDAARVLALANGLTVAATRTRLSQSARLRGGAGTEVDALIEAFDFVQVLRLRHQHRQALAGRAQDNLVPVDELSSLERRILKEALRQAKDLQVRLKLNYQL